MRTIRRIFIQYLLFLPVWSHAQNVGIGISNPLNKLHVSVAASGGTPFAPIFTPLVVEGNGHTYINLLSPNANETAVLFGKASDAASGSVMYNNTSTLNGFQFRANGNVTRMVLTSNGNLGIGLLTPNAKLSVSATGTELAGSAASTTFRTHAGSLGTTQGSEINLASIGFSSSNSSSLGIRAYRHTAGTDWTTTALILGYDMDNTIRAGGAFLVLNANGNIGIGTPTPLAKLHVYAGDGSLALFGPNSFGGQLYVGAGTNQAATSTAQVLSSDGNLHIDPAPGKNIYLGHHQPRDIIVNAFGGKVGVGTTGPSYTLDVTGSLNRIGNFVNTAASGSNIGVYASCVNAASEGFGLYGLGGYIGVYGRADVAGAGNRYGIQGHAASGTVDNIGVFGSGVGSGVNGQSAIGIYGTANGSGNNWAGFFAGSAFSTGVFVGSDRKLKSDITPLANALSIIHQLRPSAYTYKTTAYQQMNLPEGLQYGLIADEVQQVIPGIIKKAIQPAQYENLNDQNGRKLSDRVEFNAVNYTAIIPVLIAAVKEQQLMIEALKMKNEKADQQQIQINDLMNEIRLLKEKLK